MPLLMRARSFEETDGREADDEREFPAVRVPRRACRGTRRVDDGTRVSLRAATRAGHNQR